MNIILKMDQSSKQAGERANLYVLRARDQRDQYGAYYFQQSAAGQLLTHAHKLLQTAHF